MAQSNEYNVTLKIKHRREEDIVEGEPRIEIIVGLEPQSGGNVQGTSSCTEMEGKRPSKEGAGSSGLTKTDKKEESATETGSSGEQQQAGGADAPATGNNVIKMTMRMNRKRARAEPPDVMTLPLAQRRRRRRGRGSFWPFDDKNSA